ncbi:MAG: hypothetical protein II933_02300 [Candidatus Methanomethylophilaceae archaeon]|nr:hypothetical protein [Candidatus Methanomethylophilaceae archaeon]
MVQKPLITAVVIVAAILVGLSFAMVAFPDSINDFMYVYGAVGLIAILILVVMLFRMRQIRAYGIRSSPSGLKYTSRLELCLCEKRSA